MFLPPVEEGGLFVEKRNISWLEFLQNKNPDAKATGLW